MAISHRRLAAIVAVVLVASVAAWVVHVVEQRARRSPVSEQLASIARAARHDHRRIVFRAAASLHGAGRSQVLVLRDDGVPDWRRRFSVPRRDELRIYDRVDGQLREAFRFQVRGAGQIRRSDRQEFRVGIASERVILATGPLPVPVLVAWDDAARRYTPSPQRIRTRAVGEGYREPPVIVDRSRTRRVDRYAVDTYKIVRHRPFAALLGGYPDGDALLAGREPYVVELWSDDRGDAVKAVACFRSPAASSRRAPDDAAGALARWFVRHAQARCAP